MHIPEFMQRISSRSVARWVDIEALVVDSFFHCYATGGSLPGWVWLECMWSCTCRSQCDCHDDDLVLRRGATLKDVSRDFCEKVVSGLQSLNS